MRKVLLLLSVFTFLGASSLLAQDRVITGKVTSSEDGSSLPGVNVVVKGTTNGTVTDIDGNYKLAVPENGGTLVFSFIGLESQEIEIGNQSTLNASMNSDLKQLSEVIVTAQGIQKTKNELGYSAQSVKGDDITKTKSANFINSLSGKVAGLDIKRNNSLGGSTNVVIRGTSSIYGNNQALFIVDGVQMDNSVTNTTDQGRGRGGYDYGNAAADINPDDIESINVLKGAAATALYGSRASNGVILITTKKGTKKKGLGVTVNIGSTFGTIDKSTFPEYQDKYGAGYGLYYEDPTGYFLYRDASNGFGNAGGGPDLVVPTSEDASWGAPFDPNLMVYQWDAFDPSSPNYNKARPWVAAENGPITFFENPNAFNVGVSLDGSSDKGYFKFSFNRSDNDGILPNSNVTKDFVNFGGGYSLTDKLDFEASVNVSNIDGLGRYGTGYDDKNVSTNFRQWWQVNVDIKDLKAAYDRSLDPASPTYGQNVTWNWTDPTDLSAIYWDNPYFSRYENYQNDNRLRYFGYSALKYKVVDGLTFTGRVNLDTYAERQEERQAVGSTTTSSYTRFDRTFREISYDLMANFNKDLGSDFNISGIVGYNSRTTTIQSINATTNGGLVLPKFYSLSNSVSPILAPDEDYEQLRVDGVYADATFGYNKMLFLELAVRRDVTSALPKGDNSFVYPSASLSWVFTDLIGTNNWFTSGKLRANYAEVGNGAPPLSLSDYYTPLAPFGSAPLYSLPTTKNNPNLKEERTKSLEFGLEMSFFDNRLGFDATYYKLNTVDQVVPLPVSRTTGYSFIYLNAGEVENQGVELSAFASPIKTSNFNWNISLNWTRNRNQVVRLPEGINNLELGSFQGNVSLNATLGEPYGTIRGTDFQYNTNGEKIISDASGRYLQSATSNVIIGDINPDWIGGINNSFRYKNFNLSFLIDIKQGGDLFSLDMYYGLATGMYVDHAGNNDLGNPIRAALGDGGGVILPGVKEDGVTPNDQRVSAQYFGLFGYRRNPAKAFVYDASYVKLREASLTYTFPTSVISALGPVQGIDLSLFGSNLWIIHKNLPYADPEEGFASGNTASGYQGGAYPTARTYGFNLKVKF